MRYVFGSTGPAAKPFGTGGIFCLAAICGTTGGVIGALLTVGGTTWGGDCALRCGVFIMPTTMGNARAAIPAAAKAAFFAKFSRLSMRFVIIVSILFLRSAPVTPATHASGDSTYSLHTLRIASA